MTDDVFKCGLGWRLWVVPVFLVLSGCDYDEVTYFYPNGVSIYNYLVRDDPSQIFTFENGIPARLENVTINGIPVASFQTTAADDSPVRRGQGKILALSWYSTERYDIRFSCKSVQYRLPLNDFQRLQVFGRPKHVDRKRRRSSPPKVNGTWHADVQ